MRGSRRGLRVVKLDESAPYASEGVLVMSPHTPSDIHRAFADAANAGDLGALVDLFDDAAVVVERDGRLTAGRVAIRAHLDQLLSMHPKMTIVASNAYPNDDVALLCSRWTATVTLPDGTPTALDFRGSEVARRGADGTWRLIIDNPWGVDLTAAH